MTHTFRPQGVCSQQMKVELDEQGIIQDLQVMGGCHGNLQGIAVSRLKGIRCGFRATSCPDQLARNLEKILEQQ